MNSELNVNEGKVPTRAHSCSLRIKKFTKGTVFYTVYSIDVYKL